MENGWIDKGNVLAVLVGLLFCAATGFFVKSLPIVKSKSALEQNPATTKTIRMKATGYCPCRKCCGKFADGKTSIGKDAWKTLGVAADPELLDYGIKLKIPGIGIRVVDDTGRAMKKSTKNGICHIGVRFHNHEAAKKFGVKWLDVEILGPAN